MSQNYAAEYVAGCIAGSANVLSGYAFDTCKVRLVNPASAFLLCCASLAYAVICDLTFLLHIMQIAGLSSEHIPQRLALLPQHPSVRRGRKAPHCSHSLAPALMRSAMRGFPLTLPCMQVRGLYRGVSAPLIGGALETGDLRLSSQ